MTQPARTIMDNLRSQDRTVQNEAYYTILEQTDQNVDWAYEIWDELVQDLSHADNHSRSIAAQILCNLAKSDPEGRIFDDFAALMEVTKDKRFVTARHCLQSLWKIGMAGQPQKELVMKGLAERYRNCIEEKNSTLIRFDIIQGLWNLYQYEPDETIKQLAQDLIDREEDVKYRKKYAGVWKKK
ncbi:hypothetical protein [Paenibacillus mendelii]|uniref:HEAT repeat domain-containing protein n=1 Tax=Paenibacillus mendelii TaxID=206163 RepID=A0ABV6J9R4_9BACL|nr:hypothetical protein [Paenibacillus mendelii]MCQ6563757.1 hypothetical protein [Paenibacillus mendelii]